MEIRNGASALSMEQGKKSKIPNLRACIPEILLFLVLVIAAYLRFSGIHWDEYTHSHPDERFLTMVETSIKIPHSLGEYFDTEKSQLNPNNVGHGFFVYGTLPIFLVRYLAEGLGRTGYDEVYIIGRATTAFFDLLSVFLVYLIGSRLYRKRVGLLAAALTAFSVLLIQHSHFFVVDPFANTFILAGFYFAVRSLDEDHLRNYIFFGLALGMAVACKISAAPMAILIALAALTRVLRADTEARGAELSSAIWRLVLAAFISLVTFRICQPYAFSGPTFFGVVPNPRWVGNIREIHNQQSGDVDFPPALQWANRTPVLFALKNIVFWGMGMPLGIAAWAGWAWALYRMIKGRWQRNLLPVTWITLIFLWQSTTPVPAMRYQMPIYPLLALMAAWGLWQAFEWASARQEKPKRRLTKAIVGGLITLVLLGTGIWAFSFHSIYVNTNTHVAASRWIFGHIPAAVNVVIEPTSERESILEPVPVSYDLTLAAGIPEHISFKSEKEGLLKAVSLDYVTDLIPGVGEKSIRVAIYDNQNGELLGMSGWRETASDLDAGNIVVPFDSPAFIHWGEFYQLELLIEGEGALQLRSGVSLVVDSDEGEVLQALEMPQNMTVTANVPRTAAFTSKTNGMAEAIMLPYVWNPSDNIDDFSIRAEILDDPNALEPLAIASYYGSLPTSKETRLEIPLESPIEIEADEMYFMRLQLLEGNSLRLRGSVLVNETSWDLGLPSRMDGRDPFGGLYTGANQELYWADDQDDAHNGISDKQERIVDTLEQGDYLVITSNRQYGTIGRVPIRYPLTTEYYRALLGCPVSDPVWRCAAKAQPGEINGELGYDLIAIFESNPKLGPLEISDQGAEEAFTVYDHPKVLIFAKSHEFNSQLVTNLLAEVDLSRVDNSPPGQLGKMVEAKDLLLPPDRLESQQTHGTWSDLYNRNSLINRSGFMAVVIWWLTIALVGILIFPLTHAIFPGLGDRGYPLSRLLGLLLVAWGVWMLGSVNVPVTRTTVLIVLLFFSIGSGLIAWRDRQALLSFVKRKKKEIAWVEALALAFFLIDLAIRLGNPDLWHPSKGGEKPMDFAYLNAILKSTSFPPYDPWFSGGYINYYYFGFVLIGMPIKLLGIVPANAYNLVIPTLFALAAMAAYSVGYNLLSKFRTDEGGLALIRARRAGLAAALALVMLGNLGTARMIYRSLKQLGAPAGEQSSGFVAGLGQALRGVGNYFSSDQSLPIALDRWYWDPSRAIEPGLGEAGPITEFPFFTFLYADLHAHMINLAITVLTLAWGLSWLLAARDRFKWRKLDILLAFIAGGIILGALRPTNTWDYPVYWALSILALIGTAWIRHRRISVKLILECAIGVIVLFGLAKLCYRPYDYWYLPGYTAVDLWNGSHTSLNDYLTVHGLFLFVILAWMAWEAYEWMAATPLSALAHLRPYWGWIIGSAITLAAIIGVLVGLGYPIALLVFPIIIWAGIQFLRKDTPIEKQVVLTLVACGAALTFMVEVIVLRGDLSRMNTVFKFYLQVWTLFSISAAVAFTWLWGTSDTGGRGWRTAFIWVLGILVFSAALYPLTAAPAKIQDRMVASAPHTLDGMAFMPYASYYDVGEEFDMDEDYRAIRWMQDNIQGSPVIVEASIPEYRWGSRYSIHTGLPAVLGWNWHQRQQRVSAGSEVSERSGEIASFYMTHSIEEAQQFIDRYRVHYIVAGQLEQIFYNQLRPCRAADNGDQVTCDMGGRPMGMEMPELSQEDCEPTDPNNIDGSLVCYTHGLDKFDQMVTLKILQDIYRDSETVIYEVIQ